MSYYLLNDSESAVMNNADKRKDPKNETSRRINMKNHARHIIGPALLFVGLASGDLQASGPAAVETLPAVLPICEVVALPAPPVIDGRLDDGCWKTLAVHPMAYDARSFEPANTGLQTTYQIGYDSKGIYLGVRLFAADPAAIKGTITRRDDPDLWKDDCLEVYFDGEAPRAATFRKFIINPLGTRGDQMGNNIAWGSEDWQAATGREANAWTIEAFFPWADRQLRATSGDSSFAVSHGLTRTACSPRLERPLVLFNLDQGERQEVVEATIWENARDLDNLPFHRQAFAVSAPDGTTSAAQIVEKGNYWGHDFVRLAFPARVPAFGYARYTVVQATGEIPAPAPTVTQLGRDDFPARYSFHDLAEEGLENQFLRVEIDSRTGGIRRLLDKVSGLELITPENPAPMLEFGIERPHLMNSWAVDHAHSIQAPLCTGLRRKDKGPYLATIETTFTVRASEFTLVYELCDGDPRLHLRLQGTWREFGSAQTGVPFLRLAVPVNFEGARLTSEIAFGSIEREFCAGEHVPALQWVKLRGRCGSGDAGLLLLNDCKYGHSLDGNVLGVSLIRGTYDPDPQPEIGRHEMAFALQSVAADYPVSAAALAGRAFNHPLRVVGTGTHAGPLPATGALLEVEPPNLVVLSIKKPEDPADALVLRLNNPDATALPATVKPGAAPLIRA